MELNKKRQRGQMLLVTALAMAALAGFTAMAIDVGLAYRDRRDLQNDADAAALAGAAYLPADPTLAHSKAEEWLTKNGIASNQITSIEVQSTKVANDSIRVEVNDDFGWIFARLVGMTSTNINAHAKALIGTLAGTSQIMPWSVVQGDSECLDSNGDAIFGKTCSVKLGAQSKYGGGWRGALAFDGQSGANAYRDNIIDGQTNNVYCISGQFQGLCKADIVDTETGNIMGASEQGIVGRFAQGPKCDSNHNGQDDFTEVFAPTGQASPQYSVNCPNSPWLMLIPIVEYNGGKTVIIRGWTLVYFETYYCVAASTPSPSPAPTPSITASPSPTSAPTATPGATPSPTPVPGGCGGNGHWEVQVKIVDATYSQTTGWVGSFDPNTGVRVVKLIE